MKTRYTVLIIVLIIVSLVVGGILFQFNRWKIDSYESTYTYRFRISSDRTDFDFSIITPLPSKNGVPIIDEGTYETRFEEEKNWTCQFVDTKYGKMLQINGTLTSESESLTIRQDSEKKIDTREALKEEPLLYPKENITDSSYDVPHPSEWDERIDAKEYDSFISAYLGNIESRKILVDISFEGTNEWWMLGWSSNEYRDEVSFEIEPNGDHWFRGSGKMVDGLGNY